MTKSNNRVWFVLVVVTKREPFHIQWKITCIFVNNLQWNEISVLLISTLNVWQSISLSPRKTRVIYRVEDFAQMVRIGVAYICAKDFITPVTFKPILNVGCTKTPNRFTGYNAKHQIVSADCVQWFPWIARQQIVGVLIGESITNDNPIHLIQAKNEKMF